MSAWDEDYFNPKGKAYIQINKDGSGKFQFGAVQAELDGRMATIGAIQRFEFTWQGYDEGDFMSGSGWIVENDFKSIKGEIRIFQGDESTFVATRKK